MKVNYDSPTKNIIITKLIKELLSNKRVVMFQPLITTSLQYLKMNGLYENTIHLSGMRSTTQKVLYDEVIHVGTNMNKDVFCSNQSLNKVKNQCILIVGWLDDRKINGNLPRHLIPVSLNNNEDNDDLVIVVLGSNKDKYIKEKCLWDKEFVQNIAQTFRDNMSGDKHHGSVGNYMGLGTTPRYSINNDCSFGTFSQNTFECARKRLEICTR